MLALAAQPAFADGQSCHCLFYIDARPGTSWIAHGGGALVNVAGVEHLPGFVFIGRGHNHHVGNTAHKADIKAARMGGAVFTDQAGAVDGK